MLIFEDIMKYLFVFCDIVLLFVEFVSYYDIVLVIEILGVKCLIVIKLFDVYVGNNIVEGYKLMVYSLIF